MGIKSLNDRILSLRPGATEKSQPKNNDELEAELIELQRQLRVYAMENSSLKQELKESSSAQGELLRIAVEGLDKELSEFNERLVKLESTLSEIQANILPAEEILSCLKEEVLTQLRPIITQEIKGAFPQEVQEEINKTKLRIRRQKLSKRQRMNLEGKEFFLSEVLPRAERNAWLKTLWVGMSVSLFDYANPAEEKTLTIRMIDDKRIITTYQGNFLRETGADEKCTKWIIPMNN